MKELTAKRGEYPHDPWSLPLALVLIKELQPKVKAYNYHLALGGSVLNNGSSDKDLDLYFLPLDNGEITKEGSLVDFLTQRLGNFTLIIGGKEYSENNSHYTLKATFVHNNRRIDAFIS